ncbi:MAG: acyl-CoA thioesterase [Planctomycetaceae bacterium]|jgi:acyl-CoA thioester hydrolase|nr:acyl-CoA thioesterase [Planctomycetaceae bacterium]
MKLETEIQPQFSDSDALGHSNYQATVRWFEIGRRPVYQLFAPDFEVVRHHQGLFLVMASMQVDYIAETLIGKVLTVNTWVPHIGKSSFHVEQESYQDGILCSKGHLVLVCYNFTTKKSNPIPAAVRSELEQWNG